MAAREGNNWGGGQRKAGGSVERQLGGERLVELLWEIGRGRSVRGEG
jgi:hypothetical protein